VSVDVNSLGLLADSVNSCQSSENQLSTFNLSCVQRVFLFNGREFREFTTPQLYSSVDFVLEVRMRTSYFRQSSELVCHSAVNNV
jgi:hypothetical protein